MLTTASRTSTSTPTTIGTLPSTSSATAATSKQHAVGDRVEHFAQIAALVEAASDPAVDPVGRPEHGKHGRSCDALVVDEQPDEQRGAQEAQHRDQVGNRDDALVSLHHRQERMRSWPRTQKGYCSPMVRTAVDVDRGTIDELRRLRTQEGCDLSEVLRVADSVATAGPVRRPRGGPGCARCRAIPAGSSWR